MARIHYSAIVSSVSGSVGGATFQRSRYGATLKTKQIGVNKQSLNQQVAKTSMSAIQNTWRSMSQSQRDMYGKFSVFSAQKCKHNPSVLLDGYSLFLKYNLIRSHAGLLPLTDFVFELPVTYPVVFQVGAVSPTPPVLDDLFILFNEQFDSSSIFLLLKVSEPIRSTLNFTKDRCRVVSGYFDDDYTFSFLDSYTSIFRKLPFEGASIFVSLQVFSILSPFFYTPITGIFPVNF